GLRLEGVLVGFGEGVGGDSIDFDILVLSVSSLRSGSGAHYRSEDSPGRAGADSHFLRKSSWRPELTIFYLCSRRVLSALMRLRRQQRRPWQLHHRPAHVIRLRDLLDKTLWRACYQRKLHVLPVLA